MQRCNVIVPLNSSVAVTRSELQSCSDIIAEITIHSGSKKETVFFRTRSIRRIPLRKWNFAFKKNIISRVIPSRKLERITPLFPFYFSNRANKSTKICQLRCFHFTINAPLSFFLYEWHVYEFTSHPRSSSSSPWKPQKKKKKEKRKEKENTR